MSRLLLESGFGLLLESGSALLLEGEDAAGPPRVLFTLDAPARAFALPASFTTFILELQP